MIARVNKAKALTKHILCDCKCKFYGSKCNPNHKEDYGWNFRTCTCECHRNCDIDEYLKNCTCVKSNTNDSVIT